MKVQVTMSEEMVSRVDAYAEKMGVSRSALCSMLVGQGIMGYDTTFDIFSKKFDESINAKEEGSDND